MMNDRKISDLTISEFKIMMEEMFNAHDAVYQANKRSWKYANSQYGGGLDSQLSINHQFQQYNGQAANYKSDNPVSHEPAKPRK